jgi:pimeloyl-ACP methyl ester carboxylesterase
VRSALAALAFIALAFAPQPARAATGNAEVVVLLHGLYRSERSMQPLEAPCSDAGFRVVNLGYDSRSLSQDAIVTDLDAKLRACCADAPKLHFVTHSLGGIVTRAYVAAHRPANLGRVVMLAPPNHGSPLGDLVAGSTVLRFLLGSTAAQLGTDLASLPNRLPAADFELGIIAGTGNLNPLRAAFIDGDSDGTVAVSSTRLEGMRDFVTVPASHTFIMRDEQAMLQAIAFLKSGHFTHAEP